MTGSIALVVAGIGIMNILAVPVAERTREIGIRQVLDAAGAPTAGPRLAAPDLISGWMGP